MLSEAKLYASNILMYSLKHNCDVYFQEKVMEIQIQQKSF